MNDSAAACHSSPLKGDLHYQGWAVSTATRNTIVAITPLNCGTVPTPRPLTTSAMTTLLATAG